MKSNYRPNKPEFLFDEQKQVLETVTNKKLLCNGLMSYEHVKFISENPDKFITSSNNGDGTHIATITLKTLCNFLMSTDNQQKD